MADEYSEKIEALYDQPTTLPADTEGSEMAKLRREMRRRMLGNGYCARPLNWTATSSPSASRAATSSPPSSSAPL
jgi:hypothetical protein